MSKPNFNHHFDDPSANTMLWVISHRQQTNWPFDGAAVDDGDGTFFLNKAFNDQQWVL